MNTKLNYGARQIQILIDARDKDIERDPETGSYSPKLKISFNGHSTKHINLTTTQLIKIQEIINL